MNLLQLAQRLRQEVGASGSDNTVVNAAGEWRRLVDWVREAWVEVQESEPNWDFMRGEVSFVTTPTVQFYLPEAAPISLTDFRRWMPETFRIQITSPGSETFMAFIPYSQFRDLFLFGSYRDQEAVPYTMSIRPDNALALGPKPLDAYTIIGEYYKTPQVLADNTDTPNIPDYYHMIIVYRAMQFYGMYEAAQEVIMRAEREYRVLLDRLRQDRTQPAIVHRRFI